MLALLASLSWGTSDFVGGRAGRGRHVVGVMILTRPVGLLVVVVLVAITGAPLAADHWIDAAAAGVVLAGGMLCLYQALAIGPMSVVAPIFTTGAVVPVLYGLATGETPSALVLGGLAVAVAGSILAARSPGIDGQTTDPRGILLAVGAAIGLGTGLALMNTASQENAISAVFVERTVEVLLFAALLAVRWRALRPQLQAPGLLPLAGTLDLSASLLFAIASRTGLLPVVAVLSSLYPVVTVLLARAILAERMSRAQGVGAGLTLVGVAFVAVG
jgi:drug/metabolite transporter (DMT)-like permease